MTAKSAAIRLGSVEIWPTQHRLSVDGVTVRVEPKVMAVCLKLLERPGEVVTRQELMDSVWAGRVVGEEVLTRCISELRAALGDRVSDPRYIETVPKQGYRLLEIPEADLPALLPLYRRRLVAAAAAAVFAVTACLAYIGANLPEPPTRIAVLPFTTIDADQHFGSGVAEELMNTLVGLPGLRVTSRTSAFARHPDADPKVIGERLDVDALLTGSLRRSAEGIRVSAQLVDVASGDHLWADTFEGPAATVYTMQDQVIAAVTEALGIPVDPQLQVTRTTSDIDALDLYLLGRHHWHERTPEGLAQAVVYFEQAIAVDPDMSEAYSGLADAYLLQASYDDRSEASAIELAGPLIERALVLDPGSADAFASRGILLQKLGDYPGADVALSRAISLNPNSAMAHMWRGNAVMAQGRLTNAFKHYESAFALDPQHPSVTHNYINTLIELGRYDRARSILASRTAADRAMTRLSAQLAMERGEWDEASRLAGTMADDPVGAALLSWRLEVKRQNLGRAESHLAAVARQAPDDERVYLAALEHQTLTTETMQFHGVFDRWASRDDVPAKVELMTRAWLAIGRVGRGEMDAASAELQAVLADLTDTYPPFQLKLMSHLLIALAHSGQTAAYQRWQADSVAVAEEFSRAGWGSYEFQLERGYLLAAAGRIQEATESFQAAGRVGDVSTLGLSADPRISDPATSEALKNFI